jgi:hypothetical protein
MAPARLFPRRCQRGVTAADNRGPVPMRRGSEAPDSGVAVDHRGGADAATGRSAGRSGPRTAPGSGCRPPWTGASPDPGPKRRTERAKNRARCPRPGCQPPWPVPMLPRAEAADEPGQEPRPVPPVGSPRRAPPPETRGAWPGPPAASALRGRVDAVPRWGNPGGTPEPHGPLRPTLRPFVPVSAPFPGGDTRRNTRGAWPAPPGAPALRAGVSVVPRGDSRTPLGPARRPRARLGAVPRWGTRAEKRGVDVQRSTYTILFSSSAEYAAGGPRWAGEAGGPRSGAAASRARTSRVSHEAGPTEASTGRGTGPVHLGFRRKGAPREGSGGGTGCGSQARAPAQARRPAPGVVHRRTPTH